MDVFVSGATGRVGGTLATALQQRGLKVRTIAVPNDPNRAATEARGVECITGSLADVDIVRQAVEGVSSIFHMAAVISFQPTARDLLWDVNVVGTYNVLRAAAEQARHRKVRMVFASSDQVYPTRFARYRPTDELHPHEPYTFYGMSKVLGEEMVKFYNRSEANLDISTAVFSHTEAAHELIDPNGEYSGAAFYVNARVKSLKASSTHHAGANSDDQLRKVLDILEPLMGDDEPLLLTYDENGKPHTQELVDVRDIVQGLLLIHDKPEAIGETFNIAPVSPVSLAEFIPYLAEATGRRYVEAHIPVPLGRTHGSSVKARSILGFQPQYSLFDMVDEAVGRTKSK
ncbi:NAD(P)-dependent oxidoreductase [Devosia sp. YIM 151766]|uniref:NAD-dependent epimerase/dehydratase family protein n=1 Tax=Devosia sp. YIM 151766 TaxID=3017325 RepID=UPI00255CC1E3|nr:NAD(P)-dependent oxidoreductase [Devosia sp. YIM 151766]WIY52589.1 NAD(P)-dependent oxidoreductase [Devosia sp. YIM 151766]